MRSVRPRGTIREVSSAPDRDSCASGVGAVRSWVHCISAPVAVLASPEVGWGVSSGCVVIVMSPVVGSTGPQGNRAVPSGLVPVVLSCSEHIAVALPVRITQHTSRDPHVLGGTDVRLHDLQRAWGRCISPPEVSHATGARQPRFRRDVLPKPLFPRPASPVRTAAVRRCFFKGGCTFRTACATVLTACLAAPADPKPAPGRCAFGRPWGPGRVRCDAPRPFNDGTRGDGGGSHRLAAPSREQLCSHGRSPKPLVPLSRSNGSTRDRAGRPSVRPLVPSSARLRCQRARRF